MTNPLDRAYSEVHGDAACHNLLSADRLDWLVGLNVGSPASLMKVDINITTELYVDRIENGVFVLSNGKQIPCCGVQERGIHSMLIMIQPIAEDRQAFLARKYRNILTGFNWRGLTNEQLEAVIKFAEMKQNKGENQE